MGDEAAEHLANILGVAAGTTGFSAFMFLKRQHGRESFFAM
jgi:hypothetical protein